MAHDPVPTLFAHALEQLQAEFAYLPPVSELEDTGSMEQILAETAHRLADNYPYFHPLYAGQMLKAPHPLARAAYALAMAINPNNHARDGGRASSKMEIEAVSQIAAIFDWPEHLGHLTSGGTFANLEALWIAGQLAPGKRIVASEQAHYTHQRISGVLKLAYSSVPTDSRARMDLNRLEDELKKGGVGTVVATMGTTAMAAVDPLDGILALRDKYGFRIHADAAYGGYFRLIRNELDEPVRRAFEAMAQADSVVIDPHKHGLQPYGCGCILFRDPSVGLFYKHDSPYTYFTSNELHLGEISLECSRPGAAAVALWATQRLLPPVVGGEFAQGLSKCRAAAIDLDHRLRTDCRFLPLAAGGPDLDIVVWQVAGTDLEKSGCAARQLFDACAAHDLHLALVQLPHSWFASCSAVENVLSSTNVTCMRSVLIKPEHAAWMDQIWERLISAARELPGK
ncbi:MAG: pyridoxal-dependent decarboxylase [Terracidiphilus sp.]|nr:pyridoxal-dependent decarboxylase [Terracidiphilus sp.]